MYVKVIYIHTYRLTFIYIKNIYVKIVHIYTHTFIDVCIMYIYIVISKYHKYIYISFILNTDIQQLAHVQSCHPPPYVRLLSHSVDKV